MKTVAIIGAGHNGLVAACYLAQAGYDVSVYERSDRAGGLCINEELWPGYHVSTWANWSGMFQPEIVKDLELEFPRRLDTKSVILTAEGGCLYEDNIFIDGITETDRQGLERLDEDFTALAKSLRPMFFDPAPSKEKFLNLSRQFNLSYPAQELMQSSLLDTIARYVQHPQLIAATGYETFVHPAHPGGTYGYVHMCIPSAYTEYQPWDMIEGGMGGIIIALTKRADELGVKIHLNSAVKETVLDDDGVKALILEDDTKIHADFYLSNTDYAITQSLLGREVKSQLRQHQYGNANFHVKLSRLPCFPVLESHGIDIPPTFTLVPSLQDMKDAYPAYIKGEKIEKSVISLGIPTIADPARAPQGKHLLCIHPDHAPLSWSGGPWTEQDRREYFDHIIDQVAHYAPDIRECIEDWKLFCAEDLKRYGADGQHCFHGDLSWDFALDRRMPDYGAGPQTDLSNFFLCGSSCAPGGTVTGAPGYRCAQAILALES